MSRHVRTSCPHCGRGDLRIRPEHIGQRVICKHCEQGFIAEAAEVPREQLDQARSRGQELLGRLDQAVEQARLAAGLRGELDQALARIDGLVAEVDSLRSQAAEGDALRAELGQLRRHLSESATQRAEQLDALSAALDREDRAKARIGELERSLSEADAVDEVRALGEQVEGLRRERDDLSRQLDGLRPRLSDSDSRRHESLEALRVASDREERARATIADLERSLAESDAQLRHERGLRGQFEELRRERDGLSQQLEAAERRHGEERDALRAEVAQLRDFLAEVEPLKATIRHLEQSLSEADARHGREVTDLQDRSRRAEEELQRRDEQSSDERRSNEQELRTLQEEVEGLRGERDGLAGKVEKLEAERASEAKKAEASWCEVERLSRALEEAVRRNHEQERIISGHRDELAAAPTKATDEGALAELRAANERLRSLLKIFGVVKNLGEGPQAEREPLLPVPDRP